MSFTSFNEGTRWSDLYAAATCALLAGTAMFTADFALVLHLQSTGHGGIAVAALIICATLPLVVLAPLTGRMADRFDSRALMVASGLVQAAAIAAMTATDDLYALLALAALNACGTALAQPTVSALVTVIATAEDLPRAVALVQTGTLLGMAAGPAAAGFVIGAASVDAALIGAAVCALARAVLCCDIRTRRGGIRREPAPAVAPAPWRLGGDRFLRTVVIALGVAVAALCAINVLTVFLVREAYGASEGTYGIVRSAWTLGMVVGAWGAAAVIRRLTRDSALGWMMIVSLTGLGLAAFAQGLPLFSVLLLIPINLIGGMFNAGNNTVLGIAVARRVPEAFRGRANATVGARVNAATLIGFALGGVASTFVPVQIAFMLIGALAVILVLACVPSLRRAVREDDAAAEAARPVAAAA